MQKISDYSLIVESAFKNIRFIPAEPSGLYDPAVYALGAGGKQLRPSLLLMTADSFGGEKGVENAIHPALGIETFHNFTLLHDDVMDNSDTRRGRPTVHVRWDVNTAILSGDAMLTLATREIAFVPDTYLRRVLDVFNSMALEVYEGQRFDMDFEEMSEIDEDAYIEMIRRKTGALLGASAEIGAIVGGASGKDCVLMKEFGNMLGIAFQIQDDWLDTFGDAATFGKPIGGDILNDKKTYLWVQAMKGESGDVEALSAAMELKGDVKIRTVTHLYEKMNLSEKCRKAVGHYSSKALTALKKTSLPEDRKESFRLLVEKLTGRKK